MPYKYMAGPLSLRGMYNLYFNRKNLQMLETALMLVRGLKLYQPYNGYRWFMSWVLNFILDIIQEKRRLIFDLAMLEIPIYLQLP